MADIFRSIIGLLIIAGLIAVVLILTDLVKVSPRVRANVGKGSGSSSRSCPETISRLWLTLLRECG